jgi:hypothetical protein
MQVDEEDEVLRILAQAGEELLSDLERGRAYWGGNVRFAPCVAHQTSNAR